jgi:hypothetical protein
MFLSFFIIFIDYAPIMASQVNAHPTASNGLTNYLIDKE